MNPPPQAEALLMSYVVSFPFTMQTLFETSQGTESFVREGLEPSPETAALISNFNQRMVQTGTRYVPGEQLVQTPWVSCS